MNHHRIALITITAALVLDAALGFAFAAVTPGLPWWHGLFCALANAVTDGGDINPRNGAGYLITGLEYITVVPLFAATFSLLTSALAGSHVAASEQRVKQHLTAELLGGKGDHRDQAG